MKRSHLQPFREVSCLVQVFCDWNLVFIQQHRLAWAPYTAQLSGLEQECTGVADFTTEHCQVPRVLRSPSAPGSWFLSC